MVIFNFGVYLAWLLGRLGGQRPKTIFSVIFGPFVTNEETTFLKFQKSFFLLHPIAQALGGRVGPRHSSLRFGTTASVMKRVDL